MFWDFSGFSSLQAPNVNERQCMVPTLILTSPNTTSEFGLTWKAKNIRR